MRWCVVIPAYNNENSLKHVVDEVLQITDHVIVVNDGSTDQTLTVLEQIPKIKVISYSRNKGKGYAIKQGFSYALSMGYEYAVTLDADGQHSAEDIRLFIKDIQDNEGALIVGERDIQQENMSRSSSFANKFSNFWFHFIAGVRLSDTQSGFRLYPIEKLKNITFYTNRYEFEMEVLVRSVWKGIPVKSLPISVYYPEKKDRISHFRPFHDFMRISILNTILVFIALFYIKPFYFIKYLNKKTILEFFKKQLVQTQDSVALTTFSVMFGVFMGVVPIWGYQLVTAIALAHLMKLNKFIVIVAANISIPPMIPFILYGSYLTGGWILQTEQNVIYRISDITFEFVKNNLYQYVVGSLAFAVVLSLCFGVITFLMLKILKKNTVIID